MIHDRRRKWTAAQQNRHLHEHIRKFMQGNISEDEFVEQYNRLVEQEAEKHAEPFEPHEHI